MTAPRQRLLASLILGLTAVGMICALVFGPEVTDGGFGFVFLTYAAVGWLIVRHQPGNSVGWLLLAFALMGSMIGLLHGYTWLAQSAELPGTSIAGWVESWLWAPVLGIATGPLLAVFPDGHLLSPRWRFVPWASGVFVALAVVGNGLYPRPAENGGPNPYGIAGAENVLTVLTDLAGLALFISLFGGIAALVVRYRRGGVVQRQQLKWFIAAAVLVPAAIQLGEINNQALQDIATPIGMSLLAVATGIAILRHGLYDIDRIISRTVGWALVTIALGAIYLAAVTVLTSLTATVAGESTFAVAGSTLVAAAAFGPVRRRVQWAVDRRFNRARYDAARTVEAYRMRLRDNLDVESVSTHLEGAVTATLQPRTTSLWLRSPEVRS